MNKFNVLTVLFCLFFSLRVLGEDTSNTEANKPEEELPCPTRTDIRKNDLARLLAGQIVNIQGQNWTLKFEHPHQKIAYGPGILLEDDLTAEKMRGSCPFFLGRGRIKVMLSLHKTKDKA